MLTIILFCCTNSIIFYALTLLHNSNEVHVHQWCMLFQVSYFHSQYCHKQLIIVVCVNTLHNTTRYRWSLGTSSCDCSYISHLWLEHFLSKHLPTPLYMLLNSFSATVHMHIHYQQAGMGSCA